MQQVTITVRAFGTPLNLSNSPGFSENPQIAASGNNVYVTWRNLTPAGSNADVIFASSNNNGVSFGTPINITNNADFSGNPQITAIGSNVYVTWQNTTPAGNRDILFASSNNNGRALVLQ